VQRVRWLLVLLQVLAAACTERHAAQRDYHSQALALRRPRWFRVDRGGRTERAASGEPNPATPHKPIICERSHAVPDVRQR